MVRWAVAALAVCQGQDIFLSPVAPDPQARARRLVAQMTLEEKVQLTHGNKTAEGCLDDYVGCVPGLARLGIPAVRFQDGPQGFRTSSALAGTTTQWPSGMSAAMSWDEELMHSWGEAMGKEFRDKGADVIFGPAVNLHRVPLNGRNFEYISGEDPYLGRRLVQPMVKGLQSQGIVANAKHYIDNNQEGQNQGGEDGPGDRHSTSSNVDERTQVELYMAPFEGAVDAGVLSMMCGNNLVNGVHACENDFVQNVLLRESFGFQGFICSDYRGSQTMLGSALGGLDVQLPGCNKADASDPSGLTCQGQPQRPNVFGQPLLDAVKSGLVPEKVLDDKVQRLLFAMISSGALDRNRTGSIDANVTSDAHADLARRIARDSAVLLKNPKVLPLNRQLAKAGGIAVIGAAAHEGAVTGGAGSGAVSPARTSTVLQALREEFGGAVSYHNGTDSQAAVAAARKAAYAVVVLAESSQEGLDRESLTLAQSDLASAVADAQAKTVVVTASPGAFLAPWDAAILAVWMSGQEQGGAVVDLLLGTASPSGKLSLTIPNIENESAMSKEQYPGVAFEGNCTLGFETCYNATYSEQLEMGYRWYHTHGKAPKFAFGHGLTYSTFTLADLEIQGRTVTTSLRNTGTVSATETVQLYVTYPSFAGEPPKQLRGFKKVPLKPGAQQQVQFTLEDRDLSIWDVEEHAWRIVAGVFQVHVGTSSSHLPLQGTVAA